MGTIWLHGRTAGYPSVVDVLRAAGMDVRPQPGWETRSRSSGGFNNLMGVVCHHTASKTSPANDLNYMINGPDNPISNGLLDRDGVFWPIAAGASNHAGKGGGSSGGGGAPWITARGQIPPDSGNSNAFGIEAANNGTGEVWPKAQTDAYVVMCAALSAGYGLVIASDYRSHAEWSPPRKIDPRGPAPWQPANASAPWNMNAFRSDVAAAASGAGPIPTPPPEDDMPRLSNPLIQATGKDGSLSGAVYLTDGALMSYRWVRDPQELSDVQYKLRVAGLPDGIEVVDNLAAFGNEDGPAPSMAAVQTLAAELEP